MTDVKARSRAERARETRKRMRGAAHELFVSQGYADTTMKQIAAGAGVAVQTVYYTFKTKGALLCEVIEVAGAGEDGPVPVMQRPWMRETMSAPSQQRIIALAVILLSFAAGNAMNYILKINNRLTAAPYQSDWNEAQRLTENLVGMLTADLDCHGNLHRAYRSEREKGPEGRPRDCHHR